MGKLFAAIGYVITLILMCIIACPTIYAIFQLLITFFGMIGDDITGTHDNWDAAFGS